MDTQLVTKLPLLWMPIVHYRVHNSSTLNLALNQNNAVDSLTPHCSESIKIFR